MRSLLDELAIPYESVDLGEMEIPNGITDQQYGQLKTGLMTYGLDLLEDKKLILIEKIKKVIIDRVRSEDEPVKTKISDHLSSRFHLSYTYLAKLFTEATATTIEHGRAQRIYLIS